jgi:hemerythrin-like domain-containing protein
LYPAFHAVTDDEGQQLVAEAIAAHQAVQECMDALRDRDVDGEAFDARVRGLMDALEAHMATEEHALFPFAAEDLADRLEDLRDEMQELKRQLLAS